MNKNKLQIVILLRKKVLFQAVAQKRKISIQPQKNGLQYRLRNMREEDIPHVREMRREYGFYDAVSCYSTLLKIDPKCFTVAEAENGSIIAATALKKITEDTYFVGFHVTHKNYRLYGIARKIIKDAFESICHCNIVGNSDIGMLRRNLNVLPIVEKDFLNIEYEYDTIIDHDLLSSKVPRNVNIDEYQDSYLKAILDYDCSVVGYKRESTVIFNCQDPYSKTFIATKGGNCLGYGTIKRTIQGCEKVGPLYADNPAIAEALLKNLVVSFDVKRGLAAQTLSSNFYANKIFGYFDTTRKNMIPSYRLYNRRRFVTETKNIYAVFDGEYEPF